ncbi:MAG TPA: hypothetical protein VJ552_05385 [Sediminibacterium sp.]|nr:hypothetical protein [Sediminibacterium sp.]
MDLQEFRAKAYEILTKTGFKEIDGVIHYPETAVIEMLEWMQENANALPASDDEITDRIVSILDSAFSSKKGG